MQPNNQAFKQQLKNKIIWPFHILMSFYFIATIKYMFITMTYVPHGKHTYTFKYITCLKRKIE